MKYLVSLYFDDKTNAQIYQYMETVAKTTGNDFMLANRIPPHITISSFEVEEEIEVKEVLAHCFTDIKCGEIQWVGCGAFMTSSLYLTPVLNKYLQDVVQKIYESIAELPGVTVSKYYRPFQWLPHTTIGKKLNEEEQATGFRAVQGTFRVIKGKSVRIALAKACPHEDIEICFLS